MGKNDYEKIVARIIQENIKLQKKNSHEDFHYMYKVMINSITGELVDRVIIEPMFPECSLNRQAHCLAHELGHHNLHVRRSKWKNRFFSWANKTLHLKLIAFPFVIYDEYQAWKLAKDICKEEDIDTSLIHYTKLKGVMSYWENYKNFLLTNIKRLFLAYFWSVLIVLFLYMTNKAEIKLVSILGQVQELFYFEGDKTFLVNILFFTIICFWIGKWILGLVIEPKKDIELRCKDDDM
ncbi:hypothetical protein AWH56_008550 [Anaerobacillus isosaccharinicus]|uniref:Uncharacterized protein n=1 Tax=Anaerobacillus isosaccharinicus TaxID=1532552 RepID=A0A1S2L0X5_9BACI|nr:hypothetical protein [Anaerobacillus isosaccharinicus]MBA5583966.1 hypothetical protein [Anaerobacillus isosaccharinicus]QOY37616.1 hypothetical protein AWH56_008550 [Anaerobacillus isosaccharinicus]